jgi:hypothetical protein
LIYIVMPKKPTTPTAVRVARWSALAAAAAAASSFLNTMWTSAPWWSKHAEAKAASAHVSSMMAEGGGNTTASVAMAMREPDIIDKMFLYVQHNQTAVAFMVVSGMVIAVSAVMEYYHRKHDAEHKK